MARKKFIAGNWKMHKGIGDALALAREVTGLVAQFRQKTDIAIAPPFTALHPVGKALEGTNVTLAAQNCHAEPQGAFTGEVAAPMLKDAGCSWVILGHSERRQYFAETDEGVAKKTKVALDSGLTPISCVGELLAEREGGRTLEVVSRQVKGGLAGFPGEQGRSFVIAYEPVWAIGTGKTATSRQAQEVHAHVRALLVELWGGEVAQAVRIQYGGSVKPDNAAELLGQPDIDGALVGGASLKAADFLGIIAGCPA